MDALERHLDRTDQSTITKRRKNPMESTQKPAFVAAKTTTKATTRLVFRWIHLVFSIPILGYIYSPFDQIPNYAPATRFVFVPVLVLSGLWMWKGQVVRGLLSKRSA
jgi:hypothetical protein